MSLPPSPGARAPGGGPAMPIEADLHLHSYHSDGVHAPSEVVAMAVRAGLKGMALTDHDTVDGLAEAREAAPAGFEVIPASELSSVWRGREIHLLAYDVDPRNPRFLGLLGSLKEGRRLRAERMVARLNRLGVPVSMQEVIDIAQAGAAAPGASIGRPHIADAIIRHGAAADIDDAFVRYLRRGQPAWVPKISLPVGDAVRVVHEMGGAIVVAHPALNLSEPELESLATMGLDGIEVWHPKHQDDQRRRLLEIAGRLGLVATGGSDFHGAGRNRHLLASAGVSLETIDLLRQRARAARV